MPVLREPSWVDVIGHGPFVLTKENDPAQTVLRLESRLYGGSYAVDRYFDDRPDVLRDVVEQLTYQAKQRIVEEYGLAGHIEQQLAEDQVDSLGRLRSLILLSETTKYDLLVWIDNERKRVREHRR